MWATFDPSETRPFCINTLKHNSSSSCWCDIVQSTNNTKLVIFFLRNVFALLEEKKHITVYQLELNNMLQCTTPFANKLFPFLL